METKKTRGLLVLRHMTAVLRNVVSLAPGGHRVESIYVMENVTIFILGMSQKPDVTMSAFPFISSRSQSVCISDVLRIIDVVDGRGSVSRAG